MNILLIIGIVFVVIIVLLISVFAVINYDLFSYTATGSETLNPTGASAGRALVVYSPGLSGAAKRAAALVAGDLKGKGYTVILAGVRSREASNVSGYGLIVAGGPMYFGKVSNSIDTYLRTLPSNVKLGVFGTTGTDKFMQVDFDSLKAQVASDTHNDDAVLKLILNGSEAKDCSDLVSSLTQ